MNRHEVARRSAAVLMSALVVQAGSLPYFSSSAWAGDDDAPRVALLPISAGEAVPEKAPQRFRELLLSELKSRDTLEVVDLPRGKASAAQKPSSEPSAEALETLDQGQQELGELKFDAAYGTLKKGIEAMTARPEAIDFDRLTEAYVSLAVASFRMGDEDAAQKALLSVVRLAPDYKLPDGKYPPIFVREFEKARRRVEKAIRGTLNVDGPPGSTAFVDGKDLGMVPVVQENLAAGTHYVKVEGTRGQLFGQAVEVKTGTAKVKAVFQGGSSGGPQFAAVGPTLDASAAEEVANAVKALEVDYALVGFLYRSGDHQVTAATALYSAQRKGFTALKLYTFDEELLTANVEAYKLADDINDALEQFPRVASSPINLAANATYRPSASSKSSGDVEVAMVGPKRTALTPTDKPRVVEDDQTTDEQGDGSVRRLGGGAISGDGNTALDDRTPPDDTVKSSGPAWWVWALVGVGVAAAAGGTYYGVTEATRPVTGTVTVKW